MATTKKTKMRVSLEMLGKALQLPAGVRVDGIEKAVGPWPFDSVNLVLSGDLLPDAEFVEGTWRWVRSEAVDFVGFEKSEQ